MEVLAPRLLPWVLQQQGASKQVTAHWAEWVQTLPLEQIRGLWKPLSVEAQRNWFLMIEQQLKGEEKITACYRLYYAVEGGGEHDHQLLDQLLAEDPPILDRIAQFRLWAWEDIQFLNERGIDHLIERMGEPFPRSALVGSSVTLVERFSERLMGENLLQQLGDEVLPILYRGEQACIELLQHTVVGVVMGAIERPHLPLFQQQKIESMEYSEGENQHSCNWGEAGCTVQSCVLRDGEECLVKMAALEWIEWKPRFIDKLNPFRKSYLKMEMTYLDTLSRDEVAEIIAVLPMDAVIQIRKYTVRKFYQLDGLLWLSKQEVQRVLREIPTDDLVLALKGASQDVQVHFSRQMSGRAAARFQQELDQCPPVSWGWGKRAREKLFQLAEERG